jgi:hypothetical protein
MYTQQITFCGTNQVDASSIKSELVMPIAAVRILPCLGLVSHISNSLVVAQVYSSAYS